MSFIWLRGTKRSGILDQIPVLSFLIIVIIIIMMMIIIIILICKRLSTAAVLPTGQSGFYACQDT